mmetsp:Transcript_20332/g.44412  ORF Transcript_20332/g.44412 Transcript_20332/m.44412 type:complete len:190 (+) Transcript_20332:245-814(+)
MSDYGGASKSTALGQTSTKELDACKRDGDGGGAAAPAAAAAAAIRRPSDRLRAKLHMDNASRGTSRDAAHDSHGSKLVDQPETRSLETSRKARGLVEMVEVTEPRAVAASVDGTTTTATSRGDVQREDGSKTSSTSATKDIESRYRLDRHAEGDYEDAAAIRPGAVAVSGPGSGSSASTASFCFSPNRR